MSTAAKLQQKLLSGSINALQLRTLLKQQGWVLDRSKGSHEVWASGGKTLVLATHSKDLKPYQIREAQMKLNVKEGNDG